MAFDHRSIAIDRGGSGPTIFLDHIFSSYSIVRSILGWSLYSNQDGRRGAWWGSEKVAARKYERLACHPSSRVTFGYQTFVWTTWPPPVAFLFPSPLPSSRDLSPVSRVAANVPFRWLETSFLSLIGFPGFLSSEINRFFLGGVASRGHRSKPSIHELLSVDDIDAVVTKTQAINVHRRDSFARNRPVIRSSDQSDC